MIDLLAIRDQAVRDLFWVLTSPNLLQHDFPFFQRQVVADSTCQQLLIANQLRLQALIDDPSPLHQFLSKFKSGRLGLYFEALLEYFLQTAVETELIYNHQAVYKNKQTLGEVDFIFESPQRILQHWEVAVKYYICMDTMHDWGDFIGPNVQDTLALKINRLFQHQLKLTQTSECQQQLPRLTHAINAQAYVKGYLFYPQQFKSQLPAGIARNHLHGWCQRYPDLSLFTERASSMWALPTRLNWLSPCRYENDTDIFTTSALCALLQQHFTQLQQSLFLVELQARDNIYIEVSRGFILCPHWPELIDD